MTFAFTVPIRTKSTLNLREHHFTRSGRTKAQRHAVRLLWPKSAPISVPANVRLVRIAPRELDGDNLQGALKAIRDQVAAQFGLDDRDKRLKFLYDQEKGSPGVRVEIDSGERSLSDSNEWQTPRELFDACSRAFGPFTLDAAATAENALCSAFLTRQHDAPSLNVGQHRCWINPPYSRGNLGRFMPWALTQVVRSSPLFCCLVPAYTAEGWWQDNVAAPTVDLGVRTGIQEETHEGMPFIWRRWERLSIGTHFIPGRVCFTEADGTTGPARYSSAIVVYERTET